VEQFNYIATFQGMGSTWRLGNVKSLKESAKVVMTIGRTTARHSLVVRNLFLSNCRFHIKLDICKRLVALLKAHPTSPAAR